MFETLEEREEQLLRVRKETLELLGLTEDKAFNVFYHPKTTRLKKDAFNTLKKIREFIVVKVDTEGFKVQDLLKLSKIHSDLYYIDSKKAIVYTMDQDFANWVMISAGHINAIRLS